MAWLAQGFWCAELWASDAHAIEEGGRALTVFEEENDWDAKLQGKIAVRAQRGLVSV